MKQTLLFAESPSGETIKVYINEHNKFIILYNYVNSELKMTKSTHDTLLEVVNELPLHAWVLHGVKSPELEYLIKAKIEAPVNEKDIIPLCIEINERFKTAMN